MKVSIIGLGYVGLANALCLAQNDEVLAYDIDLDKVALLKKGVSPIKDTEVKEFLKRDDLYLSFTEDFSEAVSYGKYIIIATPTNYDAKTGRFDTSSIETVIGKALDIRSDAVFIIKSTIPVNYVFHLKELFGIDDIIFVPEFLREGHALYDCLYPSRVIVGEDSKRGLEVADLFQFGAKKENVPILLMNEAEAEAVKLFSNTYLALRVAYFNEIDTFAEVHALEAGRIIEGMGFDERIGQGYNNPSFGYGGYCLPKDTKQLESEYYIVPQKMMTAIIEANETRKAHIAEEILLRKPTTVGIYRLTMKEGSDNFRDSAIFGVIERLKAAKTAIVVYEPSLSVNDYEGLMVINDFKRFSEVSSVIVANRLSDELKPVLQKVYSRDIYERD